MELNERSRGATPCALIDPIQIDRVCLSFLLWRSPEDKCLAGAIAFKPKTSLSLLLKTRPEMNYTSVIFNSISSSVLFYFVLIPHDLNKPAIAQTNNV
ncbi:hypothetical protein, partial [Merismopedia glauca]|uniref:hypothetical protein n=1 Tax=Merismopedia glauca TaxID=292586 RepID=UPI0011B29F7C